MISKIEAYTNPIIVKSKPKLSPSERLEALKLLMEQEKVGSNDPRYISDLELSIERIKREYNV